MIAIPGQQSFQLFRVAGEKGVDHHARGKGVARVADNFELERLSDRALRNLRWSIRSGSKSFQLIGVGFFNCVFDLPAFPKRSQVFGDLGRALAGDVLLAFLFIKRVERNFVLYTPDGPFWIENVSRMRTI